MKRIVGAIAGLMFLASTAGAATFNFSRLADFGDGLYVYWDTFTTLVSEITSSVNNIATDQISNLQVTGAKIADSTIAVGKIVSKTLTNAVISDSAAIELQKLEDVTAGNIIVGSAANVPTQYPLTAINGDVALGWSYSTINSGAIVNADVNASAAIATTKMAFTSPTGGASPYANVVGSMWGMRYTTEPTGINTCVLNTWTAFDCDSYFSGGTIPDGNVIAILQVFALGGYTIYFRPHDSGWGLTTNTYNLPAVQGGDSGSTTGAMETILVATDSLHVVDYYATSGTQYVCQIYLLGYIGPIPK